MFLPPGERGRSGQDLQSRRFPPPCSAHSLTEASASVRSHPEESVPQKVITEKVVCYVVRNERLLVFRHRDYSDEEVGIQVPAGTIRSHETPEEAALREAREETGLDGFAIVRKLGVTEYDVTPYRYEIQRRHVFQLELQCGAPERWVSEETHDGAQLPTTFECCWISLSAAHVLQSGQGALLGRLYE